MLEITIDPTNVVMLSGRFDAAQVEKAKGVFSTLNASTTVDFSNLEYISSAGLGILLATQKRLREKQHGLKLVHVNQHIRDILKFSGFDQIFEIA